MKNRAFILIITMIIILTSGCSVKFAGKDQADNTDNGGIFKSTNRGDIWNRAVLIPTTSGRPKSIGALDISVLAMDPSDRNALYFGSVGNGTFFTYDGANSWFPIPGLSGTINDIAVDPKAKCVIYAAGGNKVFKSDDCNRTWTQVYFDTDLNIAINTIAVDHFNSDSIFIGTSRGEVLKSSNRGESWQPLKRFNKSVVRIMIDTNDSRNMFVATPSNGIHRSRDNGASWTDLGEALKEFRNSNNFKDLVFVKSQPGLIFYASQYGLLKSGDYGDNWENIELLLPERQAAINAIAVNPQDHQEIFYVTNTTFCRSTDGGETWKSVNLPTSRAGWKLLTDPEDPNVLYMGVRGVQKRR